MRTIRNGIVLLVLLTVVVLAGEAGLTRGREVLAAAAPILHKAVNVNISLYDDAAGLQAILNEYGKAGWDLVSIQGARGGGILVFKKH